MDRNHTKDANDEVKLAIKEAIGIATGNHPVETGKLAEETAGTARRNTDKKNDIVRDIIKK